METAEVCEQDQDSFSEQKESLRPPAAESGEARVSVSPLARLTHSTATSLPSTSKSTHTPSSGIAYVC